MIQFEPCALSALRTFKPWLDSLSAPFDSFLEGHLLKSEFQRILVDGQEAGSFAIHKGTLLTHFYVAGSARRFAQPAFAEIVKRFGIQAAFVATSDAFFLSHAMDDYAGIKRQACFFVDGQAAVQPPAICEKLSYRLAEPADIAAIERINNRFLDNLDKSIADGQIHLGFLQGELVAIGIIERSQLLERHASLGMLTAESHRQKGIGTCTLMYLMDVCRREGITPLAGCWYYHHASRKTLEAAGMITQTRLLRFEYGAR